MLPYTWRLISITGFFVITFEIALAIVTIVLIDDLKALPNAEQVDVSRRRFVEVGHWIHIVVFGVAIIFALTTIPYMYWYRQQRSSFAVSGLTGRPRSSLLRSPMDEVEATTTK